MCKLVNSCFLSFLMPMAFENWLSFAIQIFIGKEPKNIGKHQPTKSKSTTEKMFPCWQQNRNSLLIIMDFVENRKRIVYWLKRYLQNVSEKSFTWESWQNVRFEWNSGTLSFRLMSVVLLWISSAYINKLSSWQCK